MNGESLSIHPHVVRRRLWKIGGLLAIFTLTMFVTNCFAPPERAVTRDMLGHDFLPLYTAGEIARRGDYHHLYDLSAIKSLEPSTGRAAGLTIGFGPFWNPPFVAWLFAPFTILPFSRAVILWESISLAALIASIALMSRWIPSGNDWRNWGLIALLIFTSSPLLTVFTHAQNTCLTLLLMTITITLWRAQRALAAGLVAGLLLYKPQHAPVIALALIITLGGRGATGLAITAASLGLATMLTMPGAITDYLHKLPAIALTIQDLNPYAWDRHVTLRAFWRLLFQGTAAGPTSLPTTIFWWMSETLVALLLVRQLRLARRDTAQTDRAIALAIVAGPLLALFCFDYDLLILAAPAVLFAGDAMRRGTDRRLLATWIILFIAMYLNAYLARPTHFILAVPALFSIAVFQQRTSKKKLAAPLVVSAQRIAA